MQKLMESFGLDRLSAAERIILVEELWESVAASPEAGSLSEAHREDLQRRLDAHRDNPKAGTRGRRSKHACRRPAGELARHRQS